jgi:hypothetical protein
MWVPLACSLSLYALTWFSSLCTLQDVSAPCLLTLFLYKFRLADVLSFVLSREWAPLIKLLYVFWLLPASVSFRWCVPSLPCFFLCLFLPPCPPSWWVPLAHPLFIALTSPSCTLQDVGSLLAFVLYFNLSLLHASQFVSAPYLPKFIRKDRFILLHFIPLTPNLIPLILGVRNE